MSILENRRALATGVTAAVVIASIVGLYLAGSPAEARLLRLDERRVEDLRSIRSSLAEYRHSHGRLPPTLDSLPLAIGNVSGLRDPVTGRRYTYEVSGDSSYTLCAEFARPSPSDGSSSDDATWRHRPGHFCFRLTGTAKP